MQPKALKVVAPSPRAQRGVRSVQGRCATAKQRRSEPTHAKAASKRQATPAQTDPPRQSQTAAPTQPTASARQRPQHHPFPGAACGRRTRRSLPAGLVLTLLQRAARRTPTNTTAAERAVEGGVEGKEGVCKRRHALKGLGYTQRTLSMQVTTTGAHRSLASQTYSRYALLLVHDR